MKAVLILGFVSMAAWCQFCIAGNQGDREMETLEASQPPTLVFGSFEVKLEKAERPKYSKLGESFREIIVSRSFTEFVGQKRDELVVTVGLSAKFQGDLDRLLLIHHNQIAYYQSQLRTLGKEESANDDSDKSLRDLIEESRTFCEQSDEYVAKLLRDTLRNEDWDSVVDSVIRDAGPDFGNCAIVAEELDLSKEQIAKLRTIRTAELAIVKEIVAHKEKFNIRDTPAKFQRRLSGNSGRIGDILSEEQLVRVWRAKNVLGKDETIDEFLKRRAEVDCIENFVGASKAFRDRWNKLFPDRSLDG